MTKIAIKSVAFIAAIFSICKLSVAVEEMKEEWFRKCPKGQKNPNGISEVTGRSPVDCVRKCSQTPGCSGVNICPEMSGQVTCAVTEDPNQGECTGLTAASQPSCYYAQRVERAVPSTVLEENFSNAEEAEEETTTMLLMTTELQCENGGTVNGTRCFCPLPFAGRYCQRYMRDCSEGYENGHQDGQKGVYLIQPMTSPAPFLVQCHFAWGGFTFPLRRVVSGTPWSDVTWEQAKEGFGDDLALNSNPTNFFIGLEKLHQILDQGVYKCQIMSKYGATQETSTAFYDNFTVGPELSSYALSYDAFFDKPNTPSSNGLNGSSPIVFATLGKDLNGCAESNGAAGWYGSDCGGHSMFADPPTWPVPGRGSLQLRAVVFVLVRTRLFF